MSCGRYQTNANLSEPTADSVLVYVKSAAQKIYVQSIKYTPTDFTVATVLNFVNSLTQQVIGQIDVVPIALGASTQYILDFGPDGTPLTTGANLQLNIVAGGLTGRLVVKAYQIPLMVTATYTAPKTAGFTA